MEKGQSIRSKNAPRYDHYAPSFYQSPTNYVGSVISPHCYGSPMNALPFYNHWDQPCPSNQHRMEAPEIHPLHLQRHTYYHHNPLYHHNQLQASQISQNQQQVPSSHPTGGSLMSYYEAAYDPNATKSRQKINQLTTKPLSEQSINAKRFIPRQKIEQWDQLPAQLLAVRPRGGMDSSEMETELHRWLLYSEMRRSPYDLSAVNLIQYVDKLRYQEYSVNGLHLGVFQYYHQEMKAAHDHIQENCKAIKDIEKLFGDENNLNYDDDETKTCLQKFDLHRIISTTPEKLARVCDDIQEALVDRGTTSNFHHFQNRGLPMRLEERYNAVCNDYITRMRMLIDVEKLQSHYDFNEYDLYSCKFECIEIAPPSRPHSFCRACSAKNHPVTLTVQMRNDRCCAYHLALGILLTKNRVKNKSIPMYEVEKLERRRGLSKASIIHNRLQFENLDQILENLNPIEDKIVAHIVIPGVAENRPCATIGDLIRFRFCDEFNGSIECIGEVLQVEVKTERVMVILPCPTPNLGKHNAYTSALKYTKINPDSNLKAGRFDLRFGLFGQRSFEVFQSMIQEMISDVSFTSRLQRILAPTPLLNGITKKSSRGLPFGNYEWVTKVNFEQKQVVFDIVNCNQGSAPYILNGPPGTGKTMTLVESIIQILRCKNRSKVLVCAPSDVACDVIAKRLVPLFPSSPGERKILRVNWWSRNPSSLPPSLLSCSSTNSHGYFTLPSLDEMRAASVIICRCIVAFSLEIGCTPWMFDHFTHVIIDECSQSFEYETLVPLLKVSKKCSIIIAGDPKQLGPTVRSSTASRCGLSLSLQERLVGLPLYKPTTEYCAMTTLVNNYRSHNSLLQIPSALFYDGSLCCKASPEVTEMCKGFELLSDSNFPLLAYDVSTGKERSKLDTPSFYNVEECIAILNLVKALISSKNVDINCSHIAVITCFRAQVLKLREVLRENDLSSVNVGVVEDFQGQETSVVFISTVLTQEQDRWKIGSAGALGFMTDPKRFNVAITRGSSMCVIVGNMSFLEKSGSYWAALIEHIRQNHSISGDYDIHGDESRESVDEDYGISLFVRRFEEINQCLGVGHEKDRYELTMQGYFQDAPEWRVCL